MEALVARLLARILVAVTVVAASACGNDSPSAPSRRPSDTLPPIAEGRYRLLVTAVGASMGCEITAPGVALPGGAPLPAAGYFSQDVRLREESGGYTIRPEHTWDDRTTLELRVDASSWPSSPRVAGTLAGRSDQRAFDGPAL